MKSMKAKELMLGNAVYLEGNYIHLINANDLKYAEEYGVLSEPIEITPKILRAIGFEQEPDDYLGFSTPEWYSLDTDEYHLSVRGDMSNTKDRDWSLHIDDDDFKSVASCDVQYLHQLQNIVTIAGFDLKISVESLHSERD